ncbi:MAG: hypothetical protein JW705_00825 [Methanosarcinaceae archaeon]|nr:hypothetical protein [Methanosarcinaceae archaeon]
MYLPVPDPLNPGRMPQEMEMPDRRYAEKLQKKYDKLRARVKKIVPEQ